MSELWIPADRFLNVTRHYKQPIDALRPATARRLSELRSGRQHFVSLTVADRMLIDMGLDHFLRVDAPDGLADIYQDGKQYGSPVYVLPPAPRKYATEEERRAARREQSARSKARNKRPPHQVRVTCSECGRSRMLTAKYARRLEAGSRCASCANREAGQIWRRAA